MGLVIHLAGVAILASYGSKGNFMRWNLVGLSFCLALSLTACSKSKVEMNADGSKKLRIAVIPKGTSHSFWRSIHAGAVKAERELGT